MKNQIQMFVLGVLLSACSAQKNSADNNSARGNTRTVAVDYIDKNSYLLKTISSDNTYGYQQHNPIKVGRAESGPLNERRFLNGLSGPNGEQITYYRAGSCCPFKTPNGIFDNSGMLDRYRVSWKGSSDTVTLFINMYDEGDLKVPIGFTARKN